MTRLELAKKRAKELEKAQSNITNENTSTTSDTSKTNKRLELAKQRANNLENEYKKAQEQQQKFNDYVSKNGIDDVNEQYKNYIQTGNKIIAPKLYQTQAMQELASKRNATTPQEIAEAKPLNKIAKGVYNTIGSLGYGLGRTPTKLGMKAILNVKDEVENFGTDSQKQLELLRKGVPYSEVEKEIQADREERKAKVQDTVNRLDAETIAKYGNNGTLVGISSMASDIALATAGAQKMALAGINPVTSSAIAHGTRGRLETMADTNDKTDIAVNTGISAGFGAISGAINQVVVKGIEKIFPTTNPLSATVNAGGIIAKNAVAGGTGMYTATATTGELKNAYNKLRGREVTKEDWIKPVWSTDTLIATLIGAGTGAYYGTRADSYYRAKYQNDVSEMAKKLEIYAQKFNDSIQKGDQQSALDIARASRDELVKFSMNKYGNRTVDTNTMNDVANKWKLYLENTANYYNFVYNDMNANVNGQPKIGNNIDVNSLYQKYNIPNPTQNDTNLSKNMPNSEETSQNNVQNVLKNNTENNFKQNNFPIQGLEDYTEQDIKDIVSDYIQDTDSNIKIKGIALNGSRIRGDSKRTSDLDVVVEYEGDITEDSLFNTLNEDPLVIDGIKIDINPITANKSGTLEEYMQKSKAYDRQKNLPQEYEESEVFEDSKEYSIENLPKTEDEVESNVEKRITEKIEEEMKSFVDSNFSDYERVDSIVVDDYVDEIIDKIYTSEELDYLNEEDLRNEAFNAVYDIIDNYITEKGYIFKNVENDEHFEPDIGLLENSDEIRLKYNELPGTDFEFAQLEEIRDRIHSLVWDIEETLPNNIDVTYDESRASADATYITLYNENTDETYEIRIGNHFKSGVSGNADEHIRISDFKTISKLEEKVKEAMKNGLVDLGVENVDTVEESDYNKYTTKPKTNKISKEINNSEKAQVASEVLQWRKTEKDGIHYIDLSVQGYRSYVYNKTGYDVQTLLRIDGTEEFKNYVRKGVENGTYKKSTNFNGWITNVKTEYGRHNNDNDVLSNGRNSKTNDRTHIKSIRQQRRNNNGKIITKSGRNELTKNSNKSSFSLTKNQNSVKENSQEYEYTNEKEKLHIERAEEIFGYTDDFKKVGYLTWDGELLDFSDGSDRRIEDHRAINQVFDETFDSNSDYLIKFMNEGNIRINPETPGLEISNFTEPSNAQLDMIEEYADWNKYGGYFVVDFCNKYGDNIGSLEYENNINPSQIIDDINEFFRTGELPVVEETNNQYDNQITIEDTLLEDTNYLLSESDKPKIVGQRYWQGFHEQGYIDLNGKEVRNAQDVAELSQIFRNPKYETFRIIYTKGNTIVGQEAVSSRLPNSSKAFTDKNKNKAYYKMKDRMKRLNADGYYMIHNHPAGTAKASHNDIRLTEILSNNVQGFKGHIVVDHGTYAYIFRDNLGMNWQNELKVDNKNALYKGSQFETSLPSNKVPWNNIKIESRDELASLMHNLKNDTNYSTMILCDAQLKINAVIDIPNKFFNMRTKHIEGYIRNIAKQYGATDAFIGTPDKNVFDKIKKVSNVKDTILYKDNTTKFNKGNEIFVGKNDIAVRVGEESDIELTRKTIIDTITEGLNIDSKANKDVLQRIASSTKKMIKNGSYTINEIEKIVEDIGNSLNMRTDEYFGEYNELKQELRQRKLYVPLEVKTNITDWNEFRKQNIGRLRLTNDKTALPIDTFYSELAQKYGQGFFPSSIVNISDQLIQISNVADNLKTINLPLKEYFSRMYGYGTWEAFAEDLKIKLIELRNEYEEENNVQDKKALVANNREKQILISQGITEMEIKDPANGYVQNILKTLRSDSAYYDRTLKEIEETNNADTKRTNYLLRKRRWDILKSGKADSKYSRISNFTDMRKEIEKDIGKSIKEKGFRKRAYGIYQIREDEIRVKDLSNIETITHELGHKIDYTMLKRVEQQNENMSNELNELAERAFGNMYDNDIETKNREGWAEFVRRFITNNEITQKEYPALSSYFGEEISTQPKLKNMVTNLIGMVESYVNAPSSTLIDSMLSVGEQTDKPTKESLFDKFMYQYFDDAWYVQKLERNHAKKMGTHISKLKTEHNIYDMHRLYKGNEVSLQNILEHGFRDSNGLKVTKGLTEIFEPFEKSPEKIEQIRRLLIARRGLDYMSRGLEVGLLSPDILNTLESIKDKDVINAVNEIQIFAEEPLRMALKSGMITLKDYEELKKWNKYYVPLKRVFDEQKAPSKIGKGASKLYKERKGSLRTIIDPIESIVQNTAMLTSKIKHNEIMVELSRQAQQTNMTEFYNIVSVPMQLKNTVSAELFKDALEEQLIDLGVDTESIDYDIIKNVFAPKLADDKSMTLTFMENGKMKAIQFYDRHLYDFFAESSSGIAKNALEIFNVLDKATSVLRAGATAKNLEFTATNIVKDTITAGFYSEAGFVPGIDTIKGMVDFLIAKYGWGKGTAYSDNKINLFDYYQQSGAPMSTRVASYREGVQDYLKEAIGKYILDLNSNNEKTVRKAITNIWKGLKASADKIGDIMEFLPELSEQGTRFSYFEKAYTKYIKQGYTHKQAMLQAGIDSKDITLDFNRAGNSMRAINRLIAFSNARVQGVYRALLGIEKGIVNKKYGKKLLLKSAILIALTLAIKHMSDKDKEIEEVQQQVKLDNWVFKIGNTILKIPKAEDFTLRTLLNLSLTIFDVIAGNKEPVEASNEFLFETANSLAPIDIENIANSATPTAVKPILEIATDKDFYYGNQITPYGTEDLSSQNQYDYKTSLTARKLGQTKLAKLLNLSPAKLDHLGKGYGAGVEQQIVKITDKIIDFFDDDVILPEDSNSEKLFVRRFVTDQDRNSQSVSDVYDMYDELNTKYQDYDKADGTPLTNSEKETFEKLKTAKEALTKINKEIKTVTNSLQLSAEGKRTEIDRLKALRTDVARYYLGKPLINSKNKEQIELYEWYPSSSEYIYSPKSGLKVNVKYTENDKKKYAKLCKEKYFELIKQTKETYKYQTASKEEKEKLLSSDLTKARNYAKDTVSKAIYERGK